MNSTDTAFVPNRLFPRMLPTPLGLFSFGRTTSGPNFPGPGNIGPPQSFHFSRFQPGDDIPKSMARHEHLLFGQLGLKPGMRVLAVGCGNGSSARELYQYSNVDVIGIENDLDLIKEARTHATVAGIDDHVKFIHCGMDQLNGLFKPDSFDAIYGIETLSRSVDIGSIYAQFQRMLRPGGKLAFYEWCMSDELNSAVPEHMSISQPIEYALNGAPLRTVSQVLDVITDSGLEVKYYQDLASRDDQIPWYRCLEYPWRINCDNPLRSAWWFTCSNASNLQDHPVAQALLLGGRTKLFSPMTLVVAQKPVI